MYLNELHYKTYQSRTLLIFLRYRLRNWHVNTVYSQKSIPFVRRANPQTTAAKIPCHLHHLLTSESVFSHVKDKRKSEFLAFSINCFFDGSKYRSDSALAFHVIDQVFSFETKKFSVICWSEKDCMDTNSADRNGKEKLQEIGATLKMTKNNLFTIFVRKSGRVRKLLSEWILHLFDWIIISCHTYLIITTVFWSFFKSPRSGEFGGNLEKNIFRILDPEIVNPLIIQSNKIRFKFNFTLFLLHAYAVVVAYRDFAVKKIVHMKNYTRSKSKRAMKREYKWLQEMHFS